MPLTCAGRTDRGQVRARNEDALLLAPVRGLFAVADGMGGHAAGEVASGLAIASLENHPLPDGAVATGLKAAIHAAHRAILDAASADPALAGMGTTLTVLQVAPSRHCTIAHVGDSRAYHYANGRMRQLTRDQTWVQEQVDAGLLSPERAREHPYAAMLTHALGVGDVALDVQITTLDVPAGDVFLLCTDGLTARLTPADLGSILGQHSDLDAAAAAMVAAANAAGGPDNITVVLVRAD
jgi:PPM family protein phosphatase